MIAAHPFTRPPASPHSAASSHSDDIALASLLEQIEVATGVRCTTDESTRFLNSTNQLTHSRPDFSGPSAQDIECLRQATYQYRLETGEDRASGAALMPVLQRLGYV
ncbi:MAG: hypothetical protein R3C59_28235 [Planctomycetaceae bacterium]